MSETAESLICVLREKCLRNGFNGIKGLSVVFRALDIDYSKKIVLDELRCGLKNFGVLMSENYLQRLFRALDVNDSGEIDFCEFMHHLRPPVKQCRIDVINEAFDKLDVNKNGYIELEDLSSMYSIGSIVVVVVVVVLF